MPRQLRAAAQYIRMSTDRQDLSPLIQKAAIAAYAAANGLEVITSYENEGRSGVYLKNRPGLTQLLRDVTNASPGNLIASFQASTGRENADLALFDLHSIASYAAATSSHCACAMSIKGGTVALRAIVMQRKAQRPVQFDITEAARESVTAWVAVAQLRSTSYLFPGKSGETHLSTRQYSRIVRGGSG